MNHGSDDIGQQFQASRQRLATCRLSDLSKLARGRLDTIFAAADIQVDLSRQLLDDQALSELLQYADRMKFAERRRALFVGDLVNQTEQRPALHMALRADRKNKVFALQQLNAVHSTLDRMSHFVGLLLQGRWRGASGKPIRDLVHIGIGGSHLGVKLACRALQPYGLGRITTHHVADVDGAALADVLAQVQPEQTLFVFASKSFTTREVLVNLGSVRSWLLERGIAGSGLAEHLLAVTAHPERAETHGIAPDKCLPVWDWVTGRFSLWSAIGLPVAVQLGMPGFLDLLAGARRMDEHFMAAPMADNLPLLLALVDLWNNNVLGMASHAVLPYSQRLALLPAYLQQLHMESNGKHISRAGLPVRHRTAQVLWGGAGVDGQHSYYQYLHQGTERAAIDFILCLGGGGSLPEHQHWLVSSCLGQAEAFAHGGKQQAAKPGDEGLAIHRELQGNRPSTMIMLPVLTPHTLGQLLALFEHRVFCQSVLWDVNPFDQFGVEQGKQVAGRIHAAILKQNNTGEQTTDRLLELYRHAQDKHLA